MSEKFAGVDIIEISRIEEAISKWHDAFLTRVYTEAELRNCRNQPSSLAARFAAKEAAMKVLGTGARGINWRDIEILSNGAGAPRIRLHGKACEKAEEIGITDFSVSLSHNEQHAIAFLIGYAN